MDSFKKMWLVRHGQTDWNEQHRFQGQTDVLLNDQGRQQAKDCEQAVRWFAPQLVISSDLQRACETAQLMTGNLITISTDPRLREMAMGSWEGKTYDQLIALDAKAVQRWSEGFLSSAQGSETFDQLGQRAKSFVLDLRKIHAERILIVTHGLMLKALCGVMFDFSRTMLTRLWVDNCHCVEVWDHDGVFWLSGFNIPLGIDTFFQKCKK